MVEGWLQEYVRGTKLASFQPESAELAWIEAGPWRGSNWRHALGRSDRGTKLAILVVTGWDWNPKDHFEQYELSIASGLSVFTLYHQPNQPIFERIEDDLIAHTFERYLESGETDWPLLLPMTASVIRAMDAAQTWNPEIERFLITGVSKRGWTTWLAAASGDPRISAIAPMAFDHLRGSAQFAHQAETWGSYSFAVEDYTKRDLPSRAQEARGQEVEALVDPFTYRERIQVPILQMVGASDPYWQVDASSLYWNDLAAPRWLSTVPNGDHNLGDKLQKLETLSAFARSVNGEFEMPAPPELKLTDSLLELGAPDAGAANLWTATSESLDFRPRQWKRRGSTLELSDPLNVAVFGAARYERADRFFTLTTPTRIVRSPQQSPN